MAEYYPLISRAVAGLRTGTPEARQAIYSRARQALVGQLRAMDPPIPEDAIARETAALDEAIARTEAEIPGSDAALSATPAPQPVPPPPHQPPRPESDVPGDIAKRASFDRPVAPPPVSRPPVRIKREPPEPPPAPIKPGRPIARTVESSRPVRPPRVEAAPTLPAATRLSVEPVDETGSAESPLLAIPEDDRPVRGEAASADDKGREEAVRPAAPRPVEPWRPNLRVWIVGAVALAAVVAISVTAWRLRDNPQELSRAPATAQPAPPAGKIVERAGGSVPAPPDSGTAAVVTSDQATSTATEPASAPPLGAPAPQSAPATVQATSPGIANQTGSGAAVASSAQPAASPSPVAGDPAIPIAYKAAILVDAPNLPEKVKTYVGTVVWRASSVPQGQGQPLATEIQAIIDIPDAKTQLAMQIRRNTEAQLPASHTIDLRFTVAGDSGLGTIKQINVPQMRQPDMPTGDPLAGIPVTIADNYFLIGLMRGTSEDRNLDLLRSRQWFDIPMLLADGRASKITFEKGSAGDKIFADVLDGWKNAQN